MRVHESLPFDFKVSLRLVPSLSFCGAVQTPPVAKLSFSKPFRPILPPRAVSSPHHHPRAGVSPWAPSSLALIGSWSPALQPQSRGDHVLYVVLRSCRPYPCPKAPSSPTSLLVPGPASPQFQLLENVLLLEATLFFHPLPVVPGRQAWSVKFPGSSILNIIEKTNKQKHKVTKE